jgi:Sulfotransferase family
MMQTESLNTSHAQRRTSERSKAPVFVLGCGRSGTTLLYHMLLSSGNFAVYRTESNIINLLEPRFGDLSLRWNRRRMLKAWYDSRLYTLSGLDKKELEARLDAGCRNGGDFLRIFMEQVAEQQGMERWADCTPEHLLYLNRIKETIPDALIIQIIRDARDVTLSMDKGFWIRPLPWQMDKRLLVTGLYWEWIVQKGREFGRTIPNDYTEVHFEELVRSPRETLARLGQFIDHDLDYERIQKIGIGSVSEPNTSFHDSGTFNPIGRWKEKFPPEQLKLFEGLIGSTLEELGYELATKGSGLENSSELKRLRTMYRAYFNSKLWLKANTPLGRLLVTRDLEWI